MYYINLIINRYLYERTPVGVFPFVISMRPAVLETDRQPADQSSNLPVFCCAIATHQYQHSHIRICIHTRIHSNYINYTLLSVRIFILVGFMGDRFYDQRVSQTTDSVPYRKPCCFVRAHRHKTMEALNDSLILDFSSLLIVK